MVFKHFAKSIFIKQHKSESNLLEAEIQINKENRKDIRFFITSLLFILILIHLFIFNNFLNKAILINQIKREITTSLTMIFHGFPKKKKNNRKIIKKFTISKLTHLLIFYSILSVTSC